jgi:hypothetical protein
MRWSHPDGQYRVYLVARSDGLFCLWTEFWSDAEYEHCWLSDRMSNSIYDSEETAIREIHARFPWTRKQEPERNPSQA